MVLTLANLTIVIILALSFQVLNHFGLLATIQVFVSLPGCLHFEFIEHLVGNLQKRTNL